jgi:phosphatidate cytidylyltransferase
VDDSDRRRTRDQRRGVRIIGAEEAAAALEAGQAAGRRPLDQPRYGDVPRQPEGPRPAHRFPLPESVEPTSAVGSGVPPGEAGSDEPERPEGRRAEVAEEEWYEDTRVEARATPWSAGAEEARQVEGAYDRTDLRPGVEPYGSGEPAGAAEPYGAGEAVGMQHWAEPPTGEVPQVLLGDQDGEHEDEMAAWASLPSRKASWRDEHDDWEQSDYEPAMLADDETRVGALDDSEPDRPDVFSFDVADRDRSRFVDFFEETEEPAEPQARARRRVRRLRPPRRATRAERSGTRGPAGRDVRTAILTGVGFAVVVFVLFKLGPETALALCAVLVTLAAAELYGVLRSKGFRPATLLGLAATLSAMIANYLKGQEAVPLVLALTVGFGLLWFLFGVERARPTVNFAVTLGAFVWVGVLGSFAGLLLDPRAFPDRHGVAFLGGAVIATIAYDIGGYVVGHFGSHPLAPAISPRKTWEGLVGGMAASVLVSVVVVGHIHPWSTGSAAALGILVAVMAPLGDLCQSMVKRDLDVKDMGTLLPGHGGILDRVDAMLFVLPATYYLVRLLNIG